MTDFDDAFEFMAAADMAGSRTEPFAYGTAVFTPELPLRHDSNYLLVEHLPAGTTAAAVAREADRVQGDAGLEHRLLLFRSASAAEEIGDDLVALGWTRDRLIVMAHRRASERRVDAGVVVEVSEGAVRPARERHIRSYPWGTPEVARQLLDAKTRIPVTARFYAVEVDGEIASYGDLYLDGDIAQVEDVATLPEHRGRGYASAVVLRAVADAQAAGARLVFLVADADDWPRELYRRLGFDEIGGYVKLLKTASEAPP